MRSEKTIEIHRPVISTLRSCTVSSHRIALVNVQQLMAIENWEELAVGPRRRPFTPARGHARPSFDQVRRPQRNHLPREVDRHLTVDARRIGKLVSSRSSAIVAFRSAKGRLKWVPLPQFAP